MRLRGLKAWASERLPAGSTLRQVILSTPEEVDVYEFLGLARAWQQLVTLEQGSESNRTSIQVRSLRRMPSSNSNSATEAVQRLSGKRGKPCLAQHVALRGRQKSPLRG